MRACGTAATMASGGAGCRDKQSAGTQPTSSSSSSFSSTSSSSSSSTAAHRSKYQTEAVTLSTPGGGVLYHLGETLGRGAYGVVYKGIDIRTGRFVAIKQIPVARMGAAEAASVSNEIELLSKLRHPNIVKYVTVLRNASHISIVTEFMESGSLAATVRRFGSLPENLISRYVQQALRGLAFLHEQGVIHRDIKGANILSTKDGFVKLADFGVAAKLASGADASDQMMGDVVGTPYWMAPEIIEMSGFSTASDIWSIGCTVIELFTGYPPYHELAPMSALFRIVSDERPPIPPNVSTELAEFLLVCFRKDAEQRPSAEALLQHRWIVRNARAMRLPSARSHRMASPPTSSPAHGDADDLEREAVPHEGASSGSDEETAHSARSQRREREKKQDRRRSRRQRVRGDGEDDAASSSASSVRSPVSHPNADWEARAAAETDDADDLLLEELDELAFDEDEEAELEQEEQESIASDNKRASGTLSTGAGAATAPSPRRAGGAEPRRRLSERQRRPRRDRKPQTPQAESQRDEQQPALPSPPQRATRPSQSEPAASLLGQLRTFAEREETYDDLGIVDEAAQLDMDRLHPASQMPGRGGDAADGREGVSLASVDSTLFSDSDEGAGPSDDGGDDDGAHGHGAALSSSAEAAEAALEAAATTLAHSSKALRVRHSEIYRGADANESRYVDADDDSHHRSSDSAGLDDEQDNDDDGDSDDSDGDKSNQSEYAHWQHQQEEEQRRQRQRQRRRRRQRRRQPETPSTTSSRSDVESARSAATARYDRHDRAVWEELDRKIGALVRADLHIDSQRALEASSSIIELIREVPDPRRNLIVHHQLISLVEVLEACSIARPANELLVERLLEFMNLVASSGCTHHGMSDVDHADHAAAAAAAAAGGGGDGGKRASDEEAEQQFRDHLYLSGVVPLLVQYSSSLYVVPVRMQAAYLLDKMLSASHGKTLEMFVASRGLRALVNLLEDDYSQHRDMVDIAYAGVMHVMNSNNQRNRHDFCRLLARNGLLSRLSDALQWCIRMAYGESGAHAATPGAASAASPACGAWHRRRSRGRHERRHSGQLPLDEASPMLSPLISPSVSDIECIREEAEEDGDGDDHDGMEADGRALAEQDDDGDGRAGADANHAQHDGAPPSPSLSVSSTDTNAAALGRARQRPAANEPAKFARAVDALAERLVDLWLSFPPADSVIEKHMAHADVLRPIVQMLFALADERDQLNLLGSIRDLSGHQESHNALQAAGAIPALIVLLPASDAMNQRIIITLFNLCRVRGEWASRQRQEEAVSAPGFLSFLQAVARVPADPLRGFAIEIFCALDCSSRVVRDALWSSGAVDFFVQVLLASGTTTAAGGGDGGGGGGASAAMASLRASSVTTAAVDERGSGGSGGTGVAGTATLSQPSQQKVLLENLVHWIQADGAPAHAATPRTTHHNDAHIGAGAGASVTARDAPTSSSPAGDADGGEDTADRVQRKLIEPVNLEVLARLPFSKMTHAEYLIAPYKALVESSDMIRHALGAHRNGEFCRQLARLAATHSKADVRREAVAILGLVMRRGEDERGGGGGAVAAAAADEEKEEEEEEGGGGERRESGSEVWERSARREMDEEMRNTLRDVALHDRSQLARLQARDILRACHLPIEEEEEEEDDENEEDEEAEKSDDGRRGARNTLDGRVSVPVANAP